MKNFGVGPVIGNTIENILQNCDIDYSETLNALRILQADPHYRFGSLDGSRAWHRNRLGFAWSVRVCCFTKCPIFMTPSQMNLK